MYLGRLSAILGPVCFVQRAVGVGVELRRSKEEGNRFLSISPQSAERDTGESWRQEPFPGSRRTPSIGSHWREQPPHELCLELPSQTGWGRALPSSPFPSPALPSLAMVILLPPSHGPACWLEGDFLGHSEEECAKHSLGVETHPSLRKTPNPSLPWSGEVSDQKGGAGAAEFTLNQSGRPASAHFLPPLKPT